VHKFLNTYVAPHNLISVSIWEESHPNKSGVIYANVLHQSDENQGALTDTKPEMKLPSEGLYSMTVLKGKNVWDEFYFKKICAQINEIGGEEGHMVATANDTTQDEKVVVLFSWSSMWS
jgi:hypothetical protein